MSKQLSDRSEAVLEALKSALGRELSIDDVLDITGLDDRKGVTNTLGRFARKDGYPIERVEHGKYRYIPEAERAPHVLAEDEGGPHPEHDYDDELLFEAAPADHEGLAFRYLADLPKGDVLLQDSTGALWRARPTEVQ